MVLDPSPPPLQVSFNDWISVSLIWVSVTHSVTLHSDMRLIWGCTALFVIIGLFCKYRLLWRVSFANIVSYQECIHTWQSSSNEGANIRECHTGTCFIQWLNINKPHMSECHKEWANSLLRFLGSLKLHVSVAEYCLFYRALLQKRRVILRSLLIWVSVT